MTTNKNNESWAYAAQLSDELKDLTDTGVLLGGSIPAEVLFISSALKDAPESQNLIEPDTLDALEKSLDALGYLENSYTILSSVSLGPDNVALDLPKELMRLAIEVIDPVSIISLDKKSSSLLFDAYEQQKSPQFGSLEQILGRKVLILDGFAKSLDNPKEKQLMWHALKKLPPEQAPY